MTASAVLNDFKQNEKWLTLSFDNIKSSRFHWFWLRDNCPCPKCRHPQTWERVIDTWSIDKDICGVAVSILSEGQEVEIIWPDKHVSKYNSLWLSKHDYDNKLIETGLPAIIPWSVMDLSARPTINANDILESDEGLMAFILQVRQYGFSIIKGLSPEIGALENLAQKVGFLRETHFGIDFTVKSKPDPNNVAYTSIELKAHTDLPNLEMPPGIQFLHCLEFEAIGGDSLLVDGFAVAEQLRIENPKAFDDLTNIPVLYRFVDKDWDLRWQSPAIRLNHHGEIEEVRYHTALTGALDANFDDIEFLYDGLRAFTEILRRSEYELRFKLEPGEVMAFHNRRVLHGRGEFDPNSGPRILRGCYVDCDQAWSKLRVLQGMNN